jgi:hypothetical protein
MTTQALHSAAVTYANLLVQYHEIRKHYAISQLQEDYRAFRTAYSKMCDAANELNALAEAVASE